MGFPEEVRKELVLSFKFKRTRASWKLTKKRPKSFGGKSGLQPRYREPKLLGNLDHAFVEVRIYDERSIHIAVNGARRLGGCQGSMRGVS